MILYNIADNKMTIELNEKVENICKTVQKRTVL